MARHKKTKVFVSYSRHDEALVKPLAGLLGLAADDSVFLDVSSLKPGDLWDEKIIAAVKEASVFVLCWCCESESSTFVAKEISAALAEGGKRLVPVLFCSTPLPPTMADRQWIDLRGTIAHRCPIPHKKKPSPPHRPATTVEGQRQTAETGTIHRHRPQDEVFALIEEFPSPAMSPALHAPAPIKRSASSLWYRGAGVAAIAVVGFVAVVGYLGTRQSALPAESSESTHLPSASQPSDLFIATGSTLALIILALCIFVLLQRFWSLRKQQEQHQTESIAAAAASYFQNLGKL